MKLLLANPEGTIFEHPDLKAAGWDGQNWVIPRSDQLIPLPFGSKLFTLPHRLPVGYEPSSGNFVTITEFNDGERTFQPWAVAAFLPPAYMRLLLPAYSRKTDASPLTQWAYTMAAANEETICAAGFRVDPSQRWEPDQFDDRVVEKKVAERLKTDGNNRLIQHISHCATHYHCFAAKNFFLGRWEAPLPVARKCNASCLGCLSLQTGETPSSHQRIDFTPTPEEIADAAVSHLETGDDPMVSFGQGCEGEPLTEWELIVKAVKLIRSRTDRGTIHLNTNGSISSALPKLAEAGLDSVRVSLNSARKENYKRYFRPEDYSFDDVRKFIKTARNCGLFVHINLLIMPGINDTPPEIEAFSKLVEKTEPDLIQLKNLNIDPDIYCDSMRTDDSPIGMKEMVAILRARFPQLRFGYFNLQREKFTSG